MSSPSASPISFHVRETTGLLRGTTSKRSKKQFLTSRWKYLASAGTTLLCVGAFVHSQYHIKSNDEKTFSNVVVQEKFEKEMISLSKSSQLVGEYEEFFTKMQAMIDENADPCEDFYQYACGQWLENNAIPEDRSSIDSSFYVVAERNKEIIQQVIDEKPPVITEFYTSCLNNQEIDQESVAYVADLIHHIQKLNTTEQLISYAGELDESLGVDSFFSLQALADPKDPSINVMTLSQGGLTLPSKEYYFEKQKIDKYATLFLEYVTDLFAIGKLDHYNVSAYATNILEIETALANISLSNAALRDPWSTNKPFPLEEIENKYLPLHHYLEGVRKRQKFTRKYHAIVTTPSYFEGLTKLIMEDLPIQHLKNYLSFHVIDSFSTILGEYFRRVSHKFHGTISGLGRLSDRKKWCIDTTTFFLGDLLGEYYMKDVFSEKDRQAAQKMINQIEKDMKKLLKSETWLDQMTLHFALEKLKNVANLIGGPEKNIQQQQPIVMNKTHFFKNVVALRQLRAENVITRIGKQVDRKKWDMFASTVNAYYDPSTNKIVFPAAILQPPFYSANNFPKVANYARIGMVMGHELTHGFDDQGRNYDANGRLSKWWSKIVSDDFNTKATCLANQYSKFQVFTEDGDYIGNVNGHLTLGENIADNGGLKLTYDAFHMSKKGLTSMEENRVFFTAFAQNWCGKRSNAYAELLLSTDPHSPEKWRVNGPLMNFDQFAKTFKCKMGTPMNPKDRCIIW